MANYISPCKDKLIRLDGLLSVERERIYGSSSRPQYAIRLVYAGGDVVSINCGVLNSEDFSLEIYNTITKAL